MSVTAMARAVTTRVRGAVAELTPGQRWTTGLMVGLAVVVLMFGLPTATRVLLPAAPRAVAGSDDGGGETLTAPPPPEPAPSAEVVVPGPSAPPTTTPDGPQPPLRPAARTLQVAVLTDPAFGAGDRTDEAMAARYLDDADLDATSIAIADIAETCAAAARADLVLAGGQVPVELEACLVAAGATLVSWDDDARAGSITRGVSTRRGVARSLLDTAARLRSALDGELALVADERLRVALDPVLPRARRAGLAIRSVTYLPDDEPPSPGVAVELAGDAPAAVLFATSTANQSSIGSQLRTLNPAIDLVALDAADTIVDSNYAPVLDGLRAVTSVQFPWHPGARTARAACRTTWESAQTPPAVGSDAELLRALTWCQHVALADAVVAEVRVQGGTVGDAVQHQTVRSPITSAVAVRPDGGFAPSALAVVTWSVSCLCWQAEGRFTKAPDA